MKTKQIISLALMLGLSVTVINGCGTKEDSSANKKEESRLCCIFRNERRKHINNKTGSREKNTQ